MAEVKSLPGKRGERRCLCLARPLSLFPLFSLSGYLLPLAVYTSLTHSLYVSSLSLSLSISLSPSLYPLFLYPPLSWYLSLCVSLLLYLPLSYLSLSLFCAFLVYCQKILDIFCVKYIKYFSARFCTEPPFPQTIEMIKVSVHLSSTRKAKCLVSVSLYSLFLEVLCLRPSVETGPSVCPGTDTQELRLRGWVGEARETPALGSFYSLLYPFH